MRPSHITSTLFVRKVPSLGIGGGEIVCPHFMPSSRVFDSNPYAQMLFFQAKNCSLKPGRLCKCQQVSCEGSGRVVLTLKSYKNPSHRTYKNKCCDIRLFGCSRGCDAYFKLCVSQSSFTSVHNCNLGRYETDVIGRRDDHRFNIRKTYSFTSFQVSVSIVVHCFGNKS